MTIQDEFKAEIEAFLARHDMKPAVFGTQALHDPKFVFDLRAGRSPSVKTIEKVRDWMAGQESADGAVTPAPPPSSEDVIPSEDAMLSEDVGPPEEAGNPERQASAEPPSEKPKRHGGRNTLIAVLVVLIILFGGLAVWKPGVLYQVAASLYHRVAPSGSSTDADLAMQQFSAVVAAVQDDFNDLRQQVNRLDKRLDTLEQGTGESSGDVAVDSGRIDMLEQRIAALEQQPAANAAPSSALTGRLDALEDRMTQAESASSVQTSDLDSVRRQLDQMQQNVSSLQARQQELAALGDKVTALNDRLDSVSSGMTSMTGLQAGIEQSAIISAFMRLDADVRSGQPYAASLSLYQRQVDLQESAGEWPTAQPLKAHAESGIATNPALAARLESLIPHIIAGSEEGAGWTDRLWARVKSIVVVRRTGEQEGDTPEAIVARAETRLASGDLKGAIAQIDSLPDGKKAAAAQWLTEAHTRLDALDTLSGMATTLSATQGN